MLNRLTLFSLRHFSSVKAYNPAKNYYKMLNLTESASQKDIKRSFRELAKKYHPDSTKGKEEAFKEVNEAYQVLSDESIKREYDDERRVSTSSSYNQQQSNQSYRQSNQNQGQSYNNQQSSTYRGYQRQQGWQNRNFREQFMYDLHRTQQAENQRNFNQSDRQKYEREFRESMRRASESANQSIRQYSQAAKRKQAEKRKQFEEEEKIQQEKEKEYFRNYRDDPHNDINEKMKQKLNKYADDIAGNIKQFLSVTDELRSIWNNIKKKK